MTPAESRLPRKGVNTNRTRARRLRPGCRAKNFSGRCPLAAQPRVKPSGLLVGLPGRWHRDDLDQPLKAREVIDVVRVERELVGEGRGSDQ